MHAAEEYLRNTANPPSLHVQIGGKRRRLFINRDQNQIGIVASNKRKCGYLFTDWDSIEKVFYPSDHAPKSAEEANRQMVLKYQNDEEVAYNMTLEEDFLREREKAERKGREICMAEGREAGLAEGREAGLAEGREAGLAEGRVEMQERINKLGLQLKAAGRLDDLFRSMEDTAYQQQLLEEFGL